MIRYGRQLQEEEEDTVRVTTVNSSSISSSKKRKFFPYIILVVLLIAAITFASLFVFYFTKQINVGQPSWAKSIVSDSLLGVYQHNAVATDSPVCSLVGGYVLNVLGGNAIDSAVAVMFCLGINNFHSGGIGGGSLMLVYNKSEKNFYTYDYRETSPQNSNKDMYENMPSNASMYGGLAVAVPGEVLGLYTAHSRHGKLSWKAVLNPSIDILQEGTVLNKPVVDVFSLVTNRLNGNAPFLKEIRNWIISPKTGKIYTVGERLKDPKLLQTYKTIQADPFSFYNGSLASTIVEEVNAAGGNFTLEDLSSYRVHEHRPVITQLVNTDNLTLATLPPPSNGALVPFILNILLGFNMKPEQNNLESYCLFLHRCVEAFKFAFVERTKMGDSEFVNNTQVLDNLLSPSFIEKIRHRIQDDKTEDTSYYNPQFSIVNDAGTTHVSVVDSDGNAVSVTATINIYLGSLVKGSKTGIIYNNEMNDFAVPDKKNFFLIAPSPANFIHPGKRPLSSMSPVIITDKKGDVKFVVGAAGGTKIPTSIAYILARILILKEGVKEAMDAFRIHHQLFPNTIYYNFKNRQIPPEIIQELKKKGHNFTQNAYNSIVQIISRSTTLPSHQWEAITDFRKPSVTTGF